MMQCWQLWTQSWATSVHTPLQPVLWLKNYSSHLCLLVYYDPHIMIKKRNTQSFFRMTSVVEFPLLGVPSFHALVCFLLFFNFFKKIYLFIFREVKGEREGEKHQCVVPTQDLAHTTQACPLTGNQTLVHKPGPNPLSHTSQGLSCFVDCGHHRVTHSNTGESFGPSLDPLRDNIQNFGSCVVSTAGHDSYQKT